MEKTATLAPVAVSVRPSGSCAPCVMRVMALPARRGREQAAIKLGVAPCGMAQETSVFMPLPCNWRHCSLSAKSFRARCNVATNSSTVTGENVKARRDAGSQRHFIGVDNRVAQAADPRDNWRGARNARRKAALRPQGSKREGRESHPRRLHEMGDVLIEADLDADFPGILARGLRETLFKRLVAGAEQRNWQFRPTTSGKASSRRSSPFCQDKRADDADQKGSRSARRPKRCCNSVLFFARSAREDGS